MQQLLGYKLLPSEGNNSVLALVADPPAQRLLRHLIRRNPSVRWVGREVGVYARVCLCLYERVRQCVDMGLCIRVLQHPGTKLKMFGGAGLIFMHIPDCLPRLLCASLPA